jgi:hypothetical protein
MRSQGLGQNARTTGDPGILPETLLRVLLIAPRE